MAAVAARGSSGELVVRIRTEETRSMNEVTRTLRCIARVVVIAPAAYAALPAPAGAQQTAEVVGRAVVAGTTDGVGSALVEVVETGTRVSADAGGRFHLARLAPGMISLRVSAVGFVAADTSISLSGGETAFVTLGLVIEPVQMTGIEVSVLRPDLRRQSQMEQQAVREANPRDPGELLREVSGVDAARRGALGLDPNVQGLVETEVATFVDGERRFPAGPARMDSPLTHVDALAYRSISVVKGPYALTWGAGSLSSIRVVTETLPPERTGALHGNMTAGYDSNVHGVETSAGLIGREGAVSYWGFGAFRQGEDYEDGNGDLVQGDYRSWEARGKVGMELGSGSRMIVGGGYQEQGPVDYPGRILDADFFDTWNASAEYRLEDKSGSLRAFEANAYYNDSDHGMTNEDKPSASVNEVRIEASTRVVGGRAAASFVTDGWELEVGGDVYSANRNAVRQIRMAETDMLMLEDLIWPDATTTAGGVFARADRAFSGVLDLSGTVRLDVAGSTADTASDWFVSTVSDDLSTSSTDLSGAVTLGVHASPNWMMSAGAGSAVRAPDANELYSDRFPASKAQFAAEFVGNPELQPERSTQLDLGFEGSYSIVTLRGNAFVRSVADYITLELTAFDPKLPISPDEVYRYVNGNAFFWGLEAAGSVLVARDWTLHLRTDYLWGEDREIDEPALGIMPWRASAGLRYELRSRRFHGEAILKVAGDQTRVAVSRGESPTEGYVTGDLRFGWKVTNQLLFRFGVQNVGDRFYVNHLNTKNPFTGERIAEPGRVVYVNLGASF
jgi:iron complex outermembrane receptor protein